MRKVSKSLVGSARQKQGSLEQWALLLVLLLLLFWKKLQPVIKNLLNIACTCEDHPEPSQETSQNDINLPDAPFEMLGQSVDINKELFERQNDENVLNLDPATLVADFNPDTDNLKLITNYERTT